jgi:peptidoglycan/xylan/chitin deacetylase (PgdA/CDA1 family)
MYHQIDVPPPRGTAMRGLVVAPATFARHMAMLRRLGWRGMALRDLQALLPGSGVAAVPSAPRVFGITFDDGYLNNLTHALPVLLAHGFTATCYVPSALGGGHNDWDAALGVPRQPLMDAAQWRQWTGAGMELGAHGRHHLDLTSLDDASAADEIAGSRSELEAAIGQPVRHFCYPYGRFGARETALVRAAGYRTATTVRRGRVAPADDPFALPRVLVARTTHALQLLLKLATAYEDRRG